MTARDDGKQYNCFCSCSDLNVSSHVYEL